MEETVVNASSEEIDINTISIGLNDETDSVTYIRRDVHPPETKNDIIKSPEHANARFFDKESHVQFTQEVDVLMSKGKQLGVNQYTFLKTIGQGSFAEVKLAVKLPHEEYGTTAITTEMYAVKMIKKTAMECRRKSNQFRRGSVGSNNSTPNTTPETSPTYTDMPPNFPSKWTESLPEEVAKEIQVLTRLSHPHLVKLHEVIDSTDSKNLYLVMEYVEAGPIMTYNSATSSFVCKLTNGVMLEAMASKVFRDLMSALAYLHVHHIAHRDIKPDNLLVDFHGNLKVADFGVSNHFADERVKETRSLRVLPHSKSRGIVRQTEGTYSFYSPEMCETKASSIHSAYMADIWAASICLWIFIFGKPPFQNPLTSVLFHAIRYDDPVMPHSISPELKDLFHHILQKKPEKRLSIVEIQTHCWVLGVPAQCGEEEVTLVSASTGDSEQPEASTPVVFSPRLLAKIRAWLSTARSNILIRKRDLKSCQDELESLTISAQKDAEEAHRERGTLKSLSDVASMKRWAQKAKTTVATQKKRREKVKKLTRIKSWTESAKSSVSDRREKLIKRQSSHLSDMIEKSKLQVEKMRSAEGDDDSSDFSFSDSDGFSDSDI